MKDGDFNFYKFCRSIKVISPNLFAVFQTFKAVSCVEFNIVHKIAPPKIVPALINSPACTPSLNA